jgi:hypothetical protein
MAFFLVNCIVVIHEAIVEPTKFPIILGEGEGLFWFSLFNFLKLNYYTTKMSRSNLLPKLIIYVNNRKQINFRHLCNSAF